MFDYLSCCMYMHACRSYELQPVDKKSAAEGTSPEYEVIPAKNPTVQSNIAYGMIQLPKANNPAVVLSIQQQECESRRGDKQISANECKNPLLLPIHPKIQDIMLILAPKQMEQTRKNLLMMKYDKLLSIITH